MSHPNETLIRDAYAAFGRGDLDWLRNHAFSPAVTYHIPGRHAVSGNYEGVDAVLNFFIRLAQETDGTFAVDLVDVLANDNRVAAIHTGSGKRGGKELKMIEILLFEMQGGKVKNVWSHPRDQHKDDEFWA